MHRKVKHMPRIASSMKNVQRHVESPCSSPKSNIYLYLSAALCSARVVMLGRTVAGIEGRSKRITLKSISPSLDKICRSEQQDFQGETVQLRALLIVN